jgi:hypothetical protein
MNTPPKSCQQLIDATQELRQVLAKGHVRDIVGEALMRCEDAWLRANTANRECSRIGGSMDYLQAFADALNTASDVMHQATARIGFTAR